MIVADNISKSYPTGKTDVYTLRDVSLEIPQGKICCIIGKSGSGKTTLLRQLSLIDTPTKGAVWIDGQNTTLLSEQARNHVRLSKLGYVFQEYALIPELTALENVMLPHVQLGGDRHEYMAQALELISRVGLTNRAKYLPRDLSGGEQQRIAIARALINKPMVIFADEPTANLDSAASSATMRLLTSLSKDMGVTVVFVSHDPDEHGFADMVLNIRDGKLHKAQV